jgi:hypothetical protein
MKTIKTASYEKMSQVGPYNNQRYNKPSRPPVVPDEYAQQPVDVSDEYTQQPVDVPIQQPHKPTWIPKELSKEDLERKIPFLKRSLDNALMSNIQESSGKFDIDNMKFNTKLYLDGVEDFGVSDSMPRSELLMIIKKALMDRNANINVALLENNIELPKVLKTGGNEIFLIGNPVINDIKILDNTFEQYKLYHPESATPFDELGYADYELDITYDFKASPRIGWAI